MGKRQNILLERVSIMANKKMKTAVKSVKKQRTKKALKRTKIMPKHDFVLYIFFVSLNNCSFLLTV